MKSNAVLRAPARSLWASNLLHSRPRWRQPQAPSRVELSVATDSDRQAIYRLRHQVYACELGQHRPNSAGALQDPLDARNVYLVAKIGQDLAGFVSVTLPGGTYSVDKYVGREAFSFGFDERVYEIRLLTVVKQYRGSEMASLLMYAAFRWVEAAGGDRIIAIGRREVVDMYLRGGLQPLGIAVKSGAVTYDLLAATLAEVRQHLVQFGGLLERLHSNVDWQLHFPFWKPAACFHGGEFFNAIGPKFDRLDRATQVINADVLDAWFPPAPGVIATLREHLDWLLRTSPPTACEGLVENIASARGVLPENILPGAGSSDLIFRAFRQWLNPRSQVLILDPTYGEYAHVLERVIGCTVDRLALRREDNYDVDLRRLAAALEDNYDLVVLVNPNSPTGRHIPRARLELVLRAAPARTRIWVDETYVEYTGIGESNERFAAHSSNVIVCKSMSKVYALSGARVAYLCGAAQQLEVLRAITPPWVVGLPSQVAAVRALQDQEYYQERYRETAVLRAELAQGLVDLGFELVPGIANFVLGHLRIDGPTAGDVVKRCRRRGLFIRDAARMGTALGSGALRIAVKDGPTNARMLQILRDVLTVG